MSTPNKNSDSVINVVVPLAEVNGSALDAIFEQAEALYRTVGPAALVGMREADEREAAALAERLDVSPRRSA